MDVEAGRGSVENADDFANRPLGAHTLSLPSSVYSLLFVVSIIHKLLARDLVRAVGTPHFSLC
jgi:hypothetical protein